MPTHEAIRHLEVLERAQVPRDGVVQPGSAPFDDSRGGDMAAERESYVDEPCKSRWLVFGMR